MSKKPEKHQRGRQDSEGRSRSPSRSSSDDGGAQGTTSASEAGSASSSSGVDVDVVEGQERLQRSHDLRLRLIRLENRHLTRCLTMQNTLLERLHERTNALRDGIQICQRELGHLLRLRRGQGDAVDHGCAAEVENAGPAAEAVADVVDGTVADVAGGSVDEVHDAVSYKHLTLQTIIHV